MAREIERKFLLRDDGWRPLAIRRRRMSQAYIARGDGLSVRVRISDDEAWLNIKSGGLEAARDEFEYTIPPADADALLARARAPAIEKTRHYVPHAGFEWEIDEFHGANEGLIVAEIELDDLAQSFPVPSWIGREVTAFERYYNVMLVDHPFAEWDASERLA
jgi:adenylate cyclase